MNLQETNANAIEHWLNKIKDTDNGSRYAARKYAEKYRTAGYSPDTALDLLISNDFSIDASQGAIDDIYGIQQTQENVRTASVQKPLLPSSYKDVAGDVENTLRALGSNEFIKRLCKAQNPIVKLSSKSLTRVANLAENALYDPNAMRELHNSLEPWFEESMLNSYLLAEKMNVKVLKSKTDSDKFKVVTSKNEAIVNIKTAESTGSRYQEGNFGDFGLVDEYMICAVEELSPEFHLKRALDI